MKRKRKTIGSSNTCYPSMDTREPVDEPVDELVEQWLSWLASSEEADLHPDDCSCGSLDCPSASQRPEEDSNG